MIVTMPPTTDTRAVEERGEPSLVHVIVGKGLPMGWQLRVCEAPSVRVTVGGRETLGATGITEGKGWVVM